MTHYIVVDSEIIIGKHKANGNRPNGEIKISKTKYDKIKNEPGKIYKYINNDIVEEDDPGYLDVLKKEYIDIEKIKTRQAISNGFEYPDGTGDVYQLDEKDQNNYNSMVQKKGRLPNKVEMTLKNGEFRLVDKTKIDELTDAAFDYKMQKLQEYKDKVKLIKACTTIDELEAL